MSAAVLTKKLISTDYNSEEDAFFEYLSTVLKEFMRGRSPIFPRQVNIQFYLSYSTTL